MASREQPTRLVFDIKRFALHDGPGIRTTAFLKGCPLRCTWCHNPEGIPPRPVLWYSDSQCIGCAQCVTACPVGALSIHKKPFIAIDRKLCTECGECVSVCPSRALHWDSRPYSPADLTEELVKDRAFFETSGGGITLSGGEPLANPYFALEVLKLCRERGCRTAIETSLYAPWETVENFLPLTDLFLIDLKLKDEEAHRRFTGVSNRLILRNLNCLASNGGKFVLRVPLIPGITALEENIATIARFAAALEGESPGVELLNFNPLAESKYRALSLPYPFAHCLAPLPQEEVEKLKSLVTEHGCPVL